MSPCHTKALQRSYSFYPQNTRDQIGGPHILEGRCANCNDAEYCDRRPARSGRLQVNPDGRELGALLQGAGCAPAILTAKEVAAFRLPCWRTGRIRHRHDDRHRGRLYRLNLRTPSLRPRRWLRSLTTDQQECDHEQHAESRCAQLELRCGVGGRFAATTQVGASSAGILECPGLRLGASGSSIAAPARHLETRRFLAGDAAHLAPPLFGQGLCSGIRDAANLTWKLALVQRGADASLLDTYESERKPHARAWVEQATTMSEMIQATTPEVAAQRDAFIRAHPTEGAPRIPPLGVGFHNGEAGGLRAPQPALARPADFDEQLGYRFLIAGTAAALRELPSSVRDTLSDSPIVLVLDDSSPGVDELLKSVEADAIIVRPDRYIYGTALAGGELEPLLGPILAICRDVTDPTAA